MSRTFESAPYDALKVPYAPPKVPDWKGVPLHE